MPKRILLLLLIAFVKQLAYHWLDTVTKVLEVFYCRWLEWYFWQIGCFYWCLLKDVTIVHSTVMRPNNNNQDDVYDAVIIATRCNCSPSSFDECRLCQVVANPQTKSTNLCCESVGRLLLPSTSTIAIYYYSAQKLIRVLPFHGGWKAADCSKVMQAVYCSGCHDKYNCPHAIQTWVLSQHSQACYH